MTIVPTISGNATRDILAPLFIGCKKHTRNMGSCESPVRCGNDSGWWPDKEAVREVTKFKVQGRAIAGDKAAIDPSPELIKPL